MQNGHTILQMGQILVEIFELVHALLIHYFELSICIFCIHAYVHLWILVHPHVQEDTHVRAITNQCFQ